MNNAHTVLSSELASAVEASKLLRNPAIGADWALSLRGNMIDAIAFVGALTTLVGGYWWDVAQELEDRRLAGLRAAA